MDVDKTRRQTLLSWLFVAVLVSLCAVLGALQYRWIGEASRADRESLRERLQTSLRRLSQDFDAEITAACVALLPGRGQPDGEDREKGYELRYAQWRSTGRHPRLFRRIALVLPEPNATPAARPRGALSPTGRPEFVPERRWRDGWPEREPGRPGPPFRPTDRAGTPANTPAPVLHLRALDLNKGTFQAADWPAAWTPLRDRMSARLAGEPGRGPMPFGPRGDDLDLIDLPVFSRFEEGGPGSSPGPWFGRPREMAWLILEVDPDYVRSNLLPELMQRHLGSGEKLEYQAELTARENPSRVIFQSDPAARIGDKADASVSLFEVQFDQILRRGGGGGPFRVFGRGRGGAPGTAASFDRGRWLLSVRHSAGSLDAVVDRARRKNLAVTAAVLLLMLAAISALVRFTGRARKLAELQMEFVASVSHELRTPLSVIRTAAHNLGGGVVSSGKQVQRYGALIEDEAEKLTGIVEQVLRFSNSQAGRTIGTREALDVDALIDDTLGACSKIVEEARCTVEKHVESGIPPILGDPTALRHALQNLVANAAKYGADGGWIGITASAAGEGKEERVEIRVKDRGPGIPPAELNHVFDPFYRGRRAIDDQIHGTGLGLSLVKRIIEAHQGTVTVTSEPGSGAEFVVRIPASQAELIDEFANSSH
jgi:signal transduction histidine kinase